MKIWKDHVILNHTFAKLPLVKVGRMIPIELRYNVTKLKGDWTKTNWQLFGRNF